MTFGQRVVVYGDRSARESWIALHGFTLGPEAWANVAEHRPDLRIDAIALPGHGRDRLDADLTFEHAVDALADVARAISIGRRASVIGYSMGARFALSLVIRHPDLVARAILIGVNPGLESDEARRERAQQDQRWIELLRRAGLEAFLLAWEAEPLFRSQRAVASDRLRAQEALRRTHDPSALADALELHGLAKMPSYWDALAQLDAPPMTFVAGALDEKFRAIAERIRGLRSAAGHESRIDLVQGAGHNIILEAPERIAAML